MRNWRESNSLELPSSGGSRRRSGGEETVGVETAVARLGRRSTARIPRKRRRAATDDCYYSDHAGGWSPKDSTGSTRGRRSWSEIRPGDRKQMVFVGKDMSKESQKADERERVCRHYCARSGEEKSNGVGYDLPEPRVQPVKISSVEEGISTNRVEVATDLRKQQPKEVATDLRWPPGN
ncbi:hypothetical protein BHM03_00054156 [Ensete ventricosum]|nr:hypothetical protein BHM03_00054156 [Ensete ventricosum]